MLSSVQVLIYGVAMAAVFASVQLGSNKGLGIPATMVEKIVHAKLGLMPSR